MNKLRMNTSEMSRCFVKALCCFTTLSSYPLIQLSKISNTPSELFQSVQRPSWPQANSKPLLTFKASPLFLCTSERNRRNARRNLDQGMDIIKISFSEIISFSHTFPLMAVRVKSYSKERVLNTLLLTILVSHKAKFAWCIHKRRIPRQV